MSEEIEPQSVQILSNSLVNVAVESWRFVRLFDRLLCRLDSAEQNRYRSQFRWFQRKLEQALTDAGMHIVDVEGQSFDPGMAATPLNIEDFASEDELVVDQVLEPIIMGPQGIIRTGTVTVRKIER